MSLRVTNNLPRFSRRAEHYLHEGLGELSKDILIKSRTKAPFKKGGLRAQSDFKDVSRLHWQVRYHKEYAEYQERGMRRDGSRVVRRYSTSGTGKRFLKDSGDEIYNKAIYTLKKHARRA